MRRAGGGWRHVECYVYFSKFQDNRDTRGTYFHAVLLKLNDGNKIALNELWWFRCEESDMKQLRQSIRRAVRSGRAVNASKAQGELELNDKEKYNTLFFFFT